MGRAAGAGAALSLLLAGIVAPLAPLGASAHAPAVQIAKIVPGDYRLFDFSGWVQRWDPCQVIHYRVDTRYGGSVSVVKTAIATLAKASGLHFAYDGSTDFTPQPGDSKQPAPLVIAFARSVGEPGGSLYLHGGTQIGYGGFRSTYTKNHSGTITSYEITTGFAVIDGPRYAAMSGRIQRDTLLHELGHAVGLDHAEEAQRDHVSPDHRPLAAGLLGGRREGADRGGRGVRLHELSGCSSAWSAQVSTPRGRRSRP